MNLKQKVLEKCDICRGKISQVDENYQKQIVILKLKLCSKHYKIIFKILSFIKTHKKWKMVKK